MFLRKGSLIHAQTNNSIDLCVPWYRGGYSFLPGLWNLLNIQLQVLYNPIVNMFIGLVLMMLCSFILAEPLEGALKSRRDTG